MAMAKANSQCEIVAVQIFGEEYLIAENDAIKVQKIANYVDEKMREIDEQHPDAYLLANWRCWLR